MAARKVILIRLFQNRNQRRRPSLYHHLRRQSISLHLVNQIDKLHFIHFDCRPSVPMTGSSGRGSGATKVSKILPSTALQRIANAILHCFLPYYCMAC